MSGRAWRALTYGVPLAFFGLFFVYPLASIVLRGLRGAGDSPVGVLTDPVTREVVWFTVWQATASTVLTIAVALPATYVLGNYRFRGRSIVSALTVVPFVLPTVVGALAFIALLPSRYGHHASCNCRSRTTAGAAGRAAQIPRIPRGSKGLGFRIWQQA
jgi:thiamine transport system permease protein